MRTRNFSKWKRRRQRWNNKQTFRLPLMPYTLIFMIIISARFLKLMSNTCFRIHLRFSYSFFLPLDIANAVAWEQQRQEQNWKKKFLKNGKTFAPVMILLSFSRHPIHMWNLLSLIFSETAARNSHVSCTRRRQFYRIVLHFLFRFLFWCVVIRFFRCYLLRFFIFATPAFVLFFLFNSIFFFFVY